MSTFIYEELAKAGVEQVVITYSGSGDEGYIDEITASPGDLEYELQEVIEQEAYDVLSSLHPGWEINEGSQGHITINVAEGKAFVHHGENSIHTDYYDKELS